MEDRNMESMQEPPRPRVAWPIPAVFSALAVTSLATAGIHFAVMGEHFREYVAFGVFFSLVAWFQALWALGVVVSPTRRLLAFGLVMNAVVVVIWIVSRTAGLPIGPEPGTAEPAAFLDVLSTVLEIGVVVVTATLLVRGHSAASAGGTRNGLLSVGGLALVLALITTVAVASEGDEHAHGEEGHAEHAEQAQGPGITHVDLGEGRQLQTLIEGSAGATQVHFTFFDADGGALVVKAVEVTGVSHDGEEATIPVERFEPGHWAATVDLESGDWEFQVHGHTADGEEIATHFEATVP
jgi:hypothetical protein